VTTPFSSSSSSSSPRVPFMAITKFQWWKTSRSLTYTKLLYLLIN
jgi:hypothetical protein